MTGGSSATQTAPALSPDVAPQGATSTSRRVRLGFVDGAFALVVVATTTVYFRYSRGSFFWADDWPLALRGRTFGDFFEPYNKHFSILIIALYRTLYAIFGFDTYVPWRVAGIVCLVAVSVALFAYMRNVVGPFVAAVVASYMLWFPRVVLIPSNLNHYLALVGAIVCAAALGRRTKAADITIAAALAFALCSAGGGLSVAAACVVHAACTRAGLRRWVAVLAPTALWTVWWMVYARGVERVLPLHGRAAVDRAMEGVRGSFDALAFGNRFVGALFGIAFVVSLVWRLRAGLVAAANALAWTAAVVVWWAGLVYSRGALIDTGAFRYQFTSAVFIVLATMPSGTASAASAARWRSPVAALLVLAFAGVVVWANGDEISHLADLRRSYARATQQFLIAANQGRDVVPDSYRYEIAVGNRTAGEYRRITGYYGIPRGTDPGNPDRRLVALAPKSLRRLLRSEPCTTPDDTISAPPESRVRIRAGAHDTTVSLRRFSNEPATVATVRAGRGAVLTLHALGSKRPWTVLAPGACLDAQRSTG